jgi:hypothetical protein
MKLPDVESIFKNQLYFLYNCSQQSKKEIKNDNFIYNSIKKNKILRHKFNQGGIH